MASIGDLTATLRANTTDFTAKMDAATASSAKLALSLQDPVAQLRQLGIQAGAASGEMRALLVAQQQSIIEGLKAKGLVIVNGQLAYSATAAAEATTGLAAAETEASVAGAGFMNNASRLERSLGSLMTRLVGIPMQVGSIGVSLSRAFFGTAETLAIVAGIAVVITAVSSLIDHFRAAAKAAKEATDAIIADWKRVTLTQEEDAVNQAVANVKAAQAFLAKRQGEFLINAVSQQAVDAARTALTQANQQLDAAEKALQKAHGPSRGYGTADGTSSPAGLPKPPLTPATPFFVGGTPMSLAEAVQAAYANLHLAGPQTPATPFTNSRDNAKQLIADYQRDLNSSELRAVIERSGQTLSGAFAQGLVGGDLAKRLTEGLKRVFEDVIAKLLQDKIFSKLEDALVNALFPPTAATGGGGLLSGLGGAISSIGSGLGLSKGPVGGAMAGGTSLARGGAAPTLVVNASGSMPRALSPVEHSRDAQWLALFAETARVAPSLGIRMGVS